MSKQKEILDQIIKDIEINKIMPWEMPWAQIGLPKNLISSNAYRGINVLIFQHQMNVKAYDHNQWVSFKQAEKLGGHVRKGEKATTGLFFKPLTIENVNSEGDLESKTVPLLRPFNVFNLDQIEGVDSVKKILKENKEKGNDIDKLDVAEKIFESTGAVIKYGGGKAYYTPNHDYIQMPERKSFKTQFGYYSTKFHELTHWTGSKKRLARLKVGSSFGSADYAFEELVAELGASFLCAHVGFDYDTQHASYLKSWLKALQDNPRMLLKASSHASKAFDYVIGEKKED